MKLSEQSIKTLKPKGKRYAISDDGLILEISPSGLKVFYFKFRQDGIQHRIKLGEHPTLPLKEARKIILQKKHDIQIKNIKQPILDTTFKEFVEGDYKEWLFANNVAPSDSYRTIETHFMPLLGRFKMKNITPRQVEAWKNSRLKAGIKPATIQRNLTELRSIFSRVEDWYNHPSFMPKVKNPKITTEKEKLLLSSDEVSRLRDTCSRYINIEDNEDAEKLGWNTNNFPHMLPYIILIAINTGMRKGELLSLRYKDFSYVEDRPTITVRGETEKTKRTRDIPISDALSGVLNVWLETHAPDATPDDRMFPIGDFKKSWATFKKRAKLEHIEFKTLRHHFASSLCLANVSITTVMKLMGHTNIKTTQRYLSVRMEDKFQAVNLLPWEPTVAGD